MATRSRKLRRICFTVTHLLYCMEIQMMYKIITFVKKRNLPLLFRNKNSAFPASYAADIYFPTHVLFWELYVFGCPIFFLNT